MSIENGSLRNRRVRELRRSVFAESTEQDMVPLFVRLLRRLKSASTERRRVCRASDK